MYEAIFNENEVDGVFGISLVNAPAMESAFVALNKQEKENNIIQFAAVDDKEYILAGLVLSPDKPIYRNQGGEEFEMFFSADTVKNLCYAFTKNKFNNNSTEEHDQDNKIQGISFVENWIVRDEKKDTALALGLNPKKGDWISVAKCDNKEVYEKALSGEFTGFSIDAMIKLKQVNLKSEINMSDIKSTIKETILAALNLSKEEVKEEVKIEFGSVKSADGQFAFMFDGETPQDGGAIWIEAEDGTKVPVPVAEYELEGGQVLKVAEEGVISSVGEAQKEELEQEPAAPNTGSEDAGNVISQVQESIKSIMIKYNEDLDAKFNGIEEKFNALLESNEALKKEVVELSNQPAAEPTAQVEQVELTKNGRLLELLRNK